MRVSIVTPSYNSAKYIRETIESIRQQSQIDIEHIVMDGLSTDNTVNIVREYDSVILVSQKDHGQSNAINEGFKRTTGDLIAWQNADDIYLPGAFRTVIDFFSRHPEVDIVYGNYQLIDSESKWICDVYPIPWNTWKFAHGRFCPLQPTVFWRRKVFESVGFLDETLHYCMDVDFFSRVAKKGFTFALIPEMIGQFRVHLDSKTQNSSNEKKVFEEYKTVLARNFNYGFIDYMFFRAFQYRAKISKYIKTRIFKS